MLPVRTPSGCGAPFRSGILRRLGDLLGLAIPSSLRIFSDVGILSDLRILSDVGAVTSLEDHSRLGIPPCLRISGFLRLVRFTAVLGFAAVAIKRIAVRFGLVPAVIGLGSILAVIGLGDVLDAVGFGIVPKFIVFGVFRLVAITAVGLVAITRVVRPAVIAGVGVVGFFLVKVDFSFVGQNGLPRSAQLLGFFLTPELLEAVGPDELNAGPQIFFKVFDRKFLDHSQPAFGIACVSLGAGGH